MQKMKSFFGYFLAFLGIPLALATLMGMNDWARLLTDFSGLEVSPWFVGGKVIRTVPHTGYDTEIRRPVFDALIGETDEGFVQVDWRPKSQVPRIIDEEIDYNDDGILDFRIQWERSTGQAALTPYQPYVLGLQGTYELNERYAIRVQLKNPAK